MSYALDYPIVEHAPASERAAFIRRTYAHLAGAILAFVGLEAVLLRVLDVQQILRSMFGNGNVGMLVLLVAFFGVSWLARIWANSSTSVGIQYLGLALYVILEAIIFLPLLYLADTRFPGAIQSAGIMTLAVFLGLTAVVLLTRQDFSFLAPILCIAGVITLGVVIAAILIGFQLGVFFSFAMVAVACGFILYDTSNVLHHYRTDQHVGAALELFASVALLFWYVLRIVMASNRD